MYTRQRITHKLNVKPRGLCVKFLSDSPMLKKSTKNWPEIGFDISCKLSPRRPIAGNIKAYFLQ